MSLTSMFYKRVLLVEYACQICSLYLLRFKNMTKVKAFLSKSKKQIDQKQEALEFHSNGINSIKVTNTWHVNKVSFVPLRKCLAEILFDTIQIKCILINMSYKCFDVHVVDPS